MIDLEQYQRIKKKAEDARKAVDQAEGALQQQLKDLKQNFGCESIEEAEAKLHELEQKELSLEADYQRELAAYQEKWGALLT